MMMLVTTMMMTMMAMMMIMIMVVIMMMIMTLSLGLPLTFLQRFSSDLEFSDFGFLIRICCNRILVFWVFWILVFWDLSFGFDSP